MRKLSTLLLGGVMTLATVQAQAATFVGSRDDFRDETIYFAITTRFYDGDPMNNVCGWDQQATQIANNDPDWRGDFAGLIEKLDYIKALGFTAIWITPITQNCSGTDFHGYHSMDFSTVDLRYESRTSWGSAKDVKFQDLIDAAHAKGMKIVLDIVLNHTSNFGEKGLCELFTRSQNIKDQANVSAAIIPNYDKLPSNYNDLGGTAQYNARFPYLKNSDGTNKDNHNYWHHVGTGWNWDEPTRWWGQIAGDCVDLNTENPAVSNYLVECYGKFIEMGVDGFRIDTTGHIARATFNSAFIPQFTALFNQYASKRTDGKAFIMFGECCQRFQGSVVYRDQNNLSSFFYTWKSPTNITSAWDWDATYWDNIYIREGDDSGRYGNMALCDAEPSTAYSSNNVLMQNGAWHEPDYSEASGFNVIDFPMHYCFNNASSAVSIAQSGDKYYNDASYNVVYVDSHDYCPGPNDGTRFNGGTSQWAENLSLMFTFRGIPCLYYGSEVEFKAGCKVDAGGTSDPVKNSGRAYFGNYLEGSVTASDFGEYTASGQVATTLNADLAQHIIRLNKIRAAVPALRKGQYTFDGCSASGGWAFKRAYNKGGVDSYALVAINGGATFSNCPAGTYVDLVTGQSYTCSAGGSITVSAPTNKGQLRVLVKGWTGGKVGTDGKFIYGTSAVAHGGSVTVDDPGTTQYYTADDAVGQAKVSFSPSGSSFKTETLTVTVSLNDAATSGWYKVGNGSQVNLTAGSSKTFTIGSDMNYGDQVSVSWSATDGTSTYTGTETYKKVDPNAVITVYCKASTAPYLYAWEGSTPLNGAWPGSKMSTTTDVNGTTYYYQSFPDVQESLSIIFNNGSSGSGNQTGDITGITSDVYYEYDGGSTATEVDPGPKAPVISVSPAGGTKFYDPIQITISVSGADAVYYTTNGTAASASSTKYTGPFTISETTTVSCYASNSVGETRTSYIYTKVDEPVVEEYYVYLKNTSGWSTPTVWAWNNGENCCSNGTWPGDAMTKEGDLWKWTLPSGKTAPTQIIFSNNGQSQTADLTYVNMATYDCSGSIVGDTPSTSDTWVFFFEDSPWGNTTVHCYVWDDQSTTILGAWPGSAMTYDSTKSWWYIEFNPGRTLVNPQVIFNNGNGGGDNQTADFGAINYGVYNSTGYQFSGVESLSPTAGLQIQARNGQLIIWAPDAMTVNITSASGRTRAINVAAGTNYIDLPRGFYIVNRTKVVL
ncbi:MAG: starch-binding protein [Bacteroidales bacterium]|nr:starch-binding protein [Bacteroidales bacterium]